MSAALPEGSPTPSPKSTAQRRLLTADPETGRFDPVRLTLIAGQHWDAERLPFPWRSLGGAAASVVAKVRDCARARGAEDEPQMREGAITRLLCSQAPTTNAAPSVDARSVAGVREVA